MSDLKHLKGRFHDVRGEIAQALKILADEFKTSGSVVGETYVPAPGKNIIGQALDFVAEKIEPVEIENPVRSSPVVDTDGPLFI